MNKFKNIISFIIALGILSSASAFTFNSSNSVSSETTDVSSETSNTAIDPTQNSTSATKSNSSGKSKVSFQWQKNNWMFNNSSTFFKKGKYINQISRNPKRKLSSKLTNIEYNSVFSEDGMINEDWRGSCYGMAVTAILAMKGYLPYDNYNRRDSDGTTTYNYDPTRKPIDGVYNLPMPLYSTKISSLLTYYQMIQIKDVIQNMYFSYSLRSNEENIKDLISQIDENGVALAAINIGHAVVTYGHETGEYEFNGKKYDGKIDIYDPNYSMEEDSHDIYYNTSDHNWTIPAYSDYEIGDKKFGDGGAKFYAIISDEDILNYAGYLDAPSNKKVKDIKIEKYISRIDSSTCDDDFTVEKAVNKNGKYEIVDSNGDIKSLDFYKGKEKTTGFNLYDKNSPYIAKQGKSDELAVLADYENCELQAASSSANEIIFDPSGYIKINGDRSDFAMTMIFNSDYPTDWFKFTISGNDSENISMKKEKNGYILEGDNLQDINVKANNKSFDSNLEFTTRQNKVFLKQVGDETMEADIDLDGDGNFETPLIRTNGGYLYDEYPTQVPTCEADDPNLINIYGITIRLTSSDPNDDGIIDSKDATDILIDYANFIADPKSKRLTIDEADSNNDKIVDAKDATNILVYFANKIYGGSSNSSSNSNSVPKVKSGRIILF